MNNLNRILVQIKENQKLKLYIGLDNWKLSRRSRLNQQPSTFCRFSNLVIRAQSHFVFPILDFRICLSVFPPFGCFVFSWRLLLKFWNDHGFVPQKSQEHINWVNKLAAGEFLPRSKIKWNLIQRKNATQDADFVRLWHLDEVENE